MTSAQTRFFDFSLDLLATADAEGYFVDLNAVWCSTLGYTLDELRQKPFIDFVHPDDRVATLKEAAQLLAGGTSIQFENRYRTKSGDWRWLAWTARLSTEDRLVFACARDITHHKSLLTEKEQALSERERFRALAEHTTDFVGMATADGRAMYLNPAGKRLLGEPNLAIENLRVADCHPPRYSTRILEEGMPRAAKAGAWTSDGELRRRDGTTIPVSQVIVPLRDAQGNLGGYGTIIRELSIKGPVRNRRKGHVVQQAAWRELSHQPSTTIIQLTDHVAVILLSGVMDSHREPALVDMMLRAVETLRTCVLVIDAMSLRRIDKRVAALFVRTAAVLGLLGTQVVLTGLSDEIAQTMSSQGFALTSSTRFSTLKSGLAYALTLSSSKHSGGSAEETSRVE